MQTRLAKEILPLQPKTVAAVLLPLLEKKKTVLKSVTDGGGRRTEGKAMPAPAWTGPTGSRSMRLLVFLDNWR
jgi:hypothetical protein